MKQLYCSEIAINNNNYIINMTSLEKRINTMLQITE
jgi:hypothetical protein